MKVGFFEEEAGVKSMMRLLSFLSLWFLFVFDIMYLVILKATEVTQLDAGFISFNFLFLIASFVPKLFQKIVEMKYGKFEEETNATK